MSCVSLDIYTFLWWKRILAGSLIALRQEANVASEWVTVFFSFFSIFFSVMAHNHASTGYVSLLCYSWDTLCNNFSFFVLFFLPKVMYGGVLYVKLLHELNININIQQPQGTSVIKTPCWKSYSSLRSFAHSNCILCFFSNIMPC